MRATAPTKASGGYYVPDRDVVHEFDGSGRHVATKSALRGTTLYGFGYDAATGYLTSVTDRDGLVMQIGRAGSNVTITSPYGAQTKMALDANGDATSITSPVTTEVTRMTHGATGLMTDFWDARSNHHTFAYDTNGRLTRDTDAVAGSLRTRLTSSTSSSGGAYTVTVTSPEGRVKTHLVDPSSVAGDRLRVESRVSSMSGMATTTLAQRTDGQWSSSRAAGATFLGSSQVLSSSNDPRWGSLAPFVSAAEEKDGTRTLTRTESRTATLASPLDPYSVTAMSIAESVAASGLATRTWTRAFQYATPSTWLTTSPEGRQTRTTLDSKERVTQAEVLGTDPVALASIQYHYDGSGRVDQVTNGMRVSGRRTTPPAGSPERPLPRA